MSFSIARSYFVLCVGTFVLALAGCGNEAEKPGTPGSTENNSAKEPGKPAWDGAAVAAAERRPELDRNAQSLRRQEIAERIAQLHAQAGRLVVATEVLENGTIVDWVDRSTVEGASGDLPPPIEQPELPPGVARAEVQKLAGPPGAIPYIRPAFEPYVKGQAVGRDLDDYIRRLPTGHPAGRLESDPAGHPSEGPGGNANRLYVSNGNNVGNFGGHAFFNVIWNNTNNPTGVDFSIAELAVFCGFVTDLVGPIVGRMPGVYTGGPVFGLERFVNGAAQWVTPASQNGFVQVSSTIAPGTNIVGGSTINGTQGENEMGVAFFNAFSTNPSAWWVSFNGQWIGYFPATMFTSVGCNVNFYGEAFDASSSTTTWMNADMTSGRRPMTSSAVSNFGQVGYIRQPMVVTAVNNATGVFVTPNSPALGINHRYCYDGRWTTDGGGPWNPTLWYGGPGGNGAGCNADPGGSFGVRSGAFVCSPGCTQCTGNGCGNAGTQPGDVCCGGTITSSGRNCMNTFAPCKILTADPECRTGVLNSTGTVCCGAGCTQCGGAGCGSAGTGCCTGSITALCSGSMPPCRIDPPPPVP
jgi:hypothetical protein